VRESFIFNAQAVLDIESLRDTCLQRLINNCFEMQTLVPAHNCIASKHNRRMTIKDALGE
jgi:hypothetical protein